MDEKNIMYMVFMCLIFSISSAADWDRFTFTQEWPQTTCIMGKIEKKTCLIPQYVTYFGIHGLWPTKGSTPGPEDCEGPSFDMSNIQNLTSVLKRFWPNLYKSTPPDDFWKHEWDTHGKCASTLKATGTQYLYFRKTLDLMSQYNISSSLQRAGIYPDDKKSYIATIVERQLKKQLKVVPDLQCFKEKGDLPLLAEIRICMNQTFNLMDCYKKSDTRLLFKPSKKYEPHTIRCSGQFRFPKIKRNS